jgi:hypothetical protein
MFSGCIIGHIQESLYYILVYLKQIDQVLQQQIKLVKISYFSLGA